MIRVLISSALGLAVSNLVREVSAQPSASATDVDTQTPVQTDQPVPATPAPASAAVPAESPPIVATAAPSTATPTPAPLPAPPATHQDYDGPPLLLGHKNKKLQIGGYGGPTIAYSRMLGRDGVLIGGEGGVLIDHRLTLGGAGYAFSRTPDGPPAPDGTPRNYFSGYGGFVIRYAVYADLPIYASLGLLLGGGALTLATHDHDHEGDENTEVRGYFVAQPDASLHVNLTRWLRISLTGGYRIASGVEAFHYQASDISGAVIGGNIQGGWF